MFKIQERLEGLFFWLVAMKNSWRHFVTLSSDFLFKREAFSVVKIQKFSIRTWIITNCYYFSYVAVVNIFSDRKGQFATEHVISSKNWNILKDFGCSVGFQIKKNTTTNLILVYLISFNLARKFSRHTSSNSNWSPMKIQKNVELYL